MKTSLYIIVFAMQFLSASMELCAQAQTPPQSWSQIIPAVRELPPTATLFVPNVFTPNGDGRNDVFAVSGSGFSDMDVSIFDIRGKLVYEWRGLNGSWDGTSGTQTVEQGVYIYIVNATVDGEGMIEKAGTVKVMR